MTKETDQHSKHSILSIIRRIFLLGLSVLIVVLVMNIPTVLHGVRHRQAIRQQIEPLMKQSLELSEQIDTQQAAVNEEILAISAELKKPREQQATELEQRLKLNLERAQAIRELLKQQQEILETLQKTQEALGIVPKKENSEAKAVMEKY